MRLRIVGRALLAGALAIGGLLYVDSNSASAYVLNGARWCDRWADIVHAEAPANELPGYPVANAAATWSWIPPSDPWFKVNFDFYFYSAGNTRIQSWTRSDGINGKVATAVYYYTPWDGCMQSGGRVFFNTSYGWNTRGDPCNPPYGWYHQETAALHELGHHLGLGHSAYSGAVMYALLPACSFKGLDGDDISGATTIYGTRPR